MRSILLKKMKEHKTIILSIIISIFIEIFIYNYGFFRTLIIDNKNITPEYTINSISNNTIIEIKNIDTRVTSINFKYKNKLTDKIKYDITYLAEESSLNVNLNSKEILKNDKQYVHLDTHSKCKSMHINIHSENNNLQIENIILNHPNINISIIRFILILTILIFILKIKNNYIYKIMYQKESKTQNFFFIISLLCFMFIIFIYTLYQLGKPQLLIKYDDINKEDSILMQTESIINGQIHLLEEPSEELKKMENPYDNIKRENDEVEYLFDVAYYNGKYYNYFGIAPIITSILPFRLITGKYMPTCIFNYIYMIIAVISLYFVYRKLINKYINNISLCNFYLGFYAIIFASDILGLLVGEKYDIVISSGLAFLLISLNLAISIYNNHKHRNLKLILLGITTSLIVLSKPNFIIYYLLILFFIIIGMKKNNKKQNIKDLTLIIIPLIIFAIFQMFLNYLRFDNIFEFGAKYQLTDYNMISCMSFTFGKIYAGIVEYIFKTPRINPLKFPFIFPNVDKSIITINEICYENQIVGLIALPILYIYFLKDNIIKQSKNKELKYFINLCITLSITSIIITTCMGGICDKYSIDFKLILSIGAIILLLKWNDNEYKNKDINRIFSILCIATIIIMLPISLKTSFLINLSSDLTIYLKNLFEFWT